MRRAERNGGARKSLLPLLVRLNLRPSQTLAQARPATITILASPLPVPGFRLALLRCPSTSSSPKETTLLARCLSTLPASTGVLWLLSVSIEVEAHSLFLFFGDFLCQLRYYLVHRRTAKDRVSVDEKRAIEAVSSDVYNDLRRAAEAHRQTRKYMRERIKPGERRWEYSCTLAIIIASVQYCTQLGHLHIYSEFVIIPELITFAGVYVQRVFLISIDPVHYCIFL